MVVMYDSVGRKLNAFVGATLRHRRAFDWFAVGVKYAVHQFVQRFFGTNVSSGHIFCNAKIPDNNRWVEAWQKGVNKIKCHSYIRLCLSPASTAFEMMALGYFFFGDFGKNKRTSSPYTLLGRLYAVTEFTAKHPSKKRKTKRDQIFVRQLNW